MSGAVVGTASWQTAPPMWGTVTVPPGSGVASGEVAKWLRQRFAKPSGPKGSRGFESHPLRSRDAGPGLVPGRVSERLKEHDWKSCGVKALVGSNPTPSVASLRCPAEIHGE
jgi:hypothetical protein